MGLFINNQLNCMIRIDIRHIYTNRFYSLMLKFITVQTVLKLGHKTML